MERKQYRADDLPPHTIMYRWAGWNKDELEAVLVLKETEKTFLILDKSWYPTEGSCTRYYETRVLKDHGRFGFRIYPTREEAITAREVSMRARRNEARRTVGVVEEEYKEFCAKFNLPEK